MIDPHPTTSNNINNINNINTINNRIGDRLKSVPGV